MSIGTERWATATGATGVSVIRKERTQARAPHLVCEGSRAEDAHAIAVLPEALALLKRHLDENGGHTQECYEHAGACVGLCSDTRALLRRAGVLK